MSDERWEVVEPLDDRTIYKVRLPLSSTEVATSYLPLGRAAKGTFQLESIGETALSSGAVVIQRSNNQSRPSVDLESSVTLSAEGMSASANLDSFGYLRAVCSTSQANVVVEITACIVNRENV